MYPYQTSACILFHIFVQQSPKTLHIFISTTYQKLEIYSWILIEHSFSLFLDSFWDLIQHFSSYRKETALEWYTSEVRTKLSIAKLYYSNSLPLTPGKHWLFFNCLYSFVLSRVSYICNHAACSFLMAWVW